MPKAVDSTGWEALYGELYGPLVRLAGLLVCDYQLGEEIAQDAFARLVEARASVADPALYLRATVTNLCRSRIRRLTVARRHPFQLSVVDVGDSLADRVADDLLFRSALARLPARQREAVVLRYYADLSESDMAETMGVSVGSIKTHLHRAMKALASSLGEPA